MPSPRALAIAAILAATIALPGTSSAAPREVSIRAGDGLTLRGSWRPAERRTGRAVLLLHEMCGNRAAWEPFLAGLSAAGIDTVAVDLRGFGATGGKMEWADEVSDARAWFAWLSGQPGVERIGVVGESLGAKLALAICGGEVRCRVAAAISPYGTFTQRELDFRDRAVYLLGVRGDDVHSAQAVRRIASDVQGDVTLRLVAGIEPGIATALEGNHVDEVVTWVDRHLTSAD